MKLLMIEDKVSLTDAVAEYFKNQKVSITICNDGEKGYLEALSATYDVIILDIMLPKKDVGLFWLIYERKILIHQSLC